MDRSVGPRAGNEVPRDMVYGNRHGPRGVDGDESSEAVAEMSMWMKDINSGDRLFYRLNETTGDIGVTRYYPESKLMLDIGSIPVRDSNDRQEWYLFSGEWAPSVSLSRLLYV